MKTLQEARDLLDSFIDEGLSEHVLVSLSWVDPPKANAGEKPPSPRKPSGEFKQSPSGRYDYSRSYKNIPRSLVVCHRSPEKPGRISRVWERFHHRASKNGGRIKKSDAIAILRSAGYQKPEGELGRFFHDYKILLPPSEEVT